MKAGLTKTEKAALDAIRELTVDGLAPTYDEIAAHLGRRSRGQIAGLVQSLRRKGRIEVGRNSRSIRIIEDGLPSEVEIGAASAARLRGVLEDAVEALAAQIGRAAAADILSHILQNQRATVKREAEASTKPPPQPHRFSPKSG